MHCLVDTHPESSDSVSTLTELAFAKRSFILDTLRLTWRLHWEKSLMKENKLEWKCIHEIIVNIHNYFQSNTFGHMQKIKRVHAKKQMNRVTSLRILSTLECKRYSIWFWNEIVIQCKKDKIPVLEALQFCHPFQGWYPSDRCQQP